MKSFLLALAFALGLASPASASLVYVTYTGTVSSGNSCDAACTSSGGQGNINLAGDSYVASYVFDTANSVQFAGPTLNENLGGPGYGSPSPALSAVFTVAGQTFSVAPIFGSEIYGTNYPSYDKSTYSKQSHWTMQDQSIGLVEVMAQLTNTAVNLNGLLPAAISGNFQIDLSGDQVSGTAFFSAYDHSTGGYLYQTYTLLTPQFLTISTVAPVVPEPSTWATMLLGFGALGLAGWRRRRAVA